MQSSAVLPPTFNELATLMAKKKLDIHSFKLCSIRLEDDIAAHATWAFNHIYNIPYPGEEAKAKERGIARLMHGIQHTRRVAMLIPVFANLYRRYNDHDALALTEEDIKLRQIAALFHDSARENEGKDFWDKESGKLLYFYLTNVLNVTHEKATLLAEAVSNKDAEPPKNSYQKLIHDADCLDIIRATDEYQDR